jgi:hypothetical protein
MDDEDREDEKMRFEVALGERDGRMKEEDVHP